MGMSHLKSLNPQLLKDIAYVFFSFLLLLAKNLIQFWYNLTILWSMPSSSGRQFHWGDHMKECMYHKPNKVGQLCLRRKWKWDEICSDVVLCWGDPLKGRLQQLEGSGPSFLNFFYQKLAAKKTKLKGRFDDKVHGRDHRQRYYPRFFSEKQFLIISKWAPFTISANRPTIHYGLGKCYSSGLVITCLHGRKKKRDFIYELVTNAHLGDFIEDDLPTPRFGRNVKEILPATIVWKFFRPKRSCFQLSKVVN